MQEGMGAVGGGVGDVLFCGIIQNVYIQEDEVGVLWGCEASTREGGGDGICYLGHGIRGLDFGGGPWALPFPGVSAALCCAVRKLALRGGNVAAALGKQRAEDREQMAAKCSVCRLGSLVLARLEAARRRVFCFVAAGVAPCFCLGERTEFGIRNLGEALCCAGRRLALRFGSVAVASSRSSMFGICGKRWVLGSLCCA